MSKDRLKNIAASVRTRLTDLARHQKEDFQFVLTRYAIERVLFRLTQTIHATEFILKGAMLFRLWINMSHRPTRDVDLLGRGDPSPERLEAIFQEVCSVSVTDDGLTLDPTTVKAEKIKEDQEYEGVRITFVAQLGQARIDVQVDVGFGDAVNPGPTQVRYPSLLDFPAPELLAYPKETVVAEKFQAMASLGIANSRMKDFFDVWLLAQSFSFDGTDLANAIQATFARRKTAVPATPPMALTTEFGNAANKVTQWRAFLNRSKLGVGKVELVEVCQFLSTFLMPPTQAIARGMDFDHNWPVGGPWPVES